MTFLVDLQMLSLGGMVEAAAVGDAWSFQVWHRDTVMGLPTLNFTDACALRFTH